MSVREWFDGVIDRADHHVETPRDTVQFSRYQHGDGAELVDLSNPDAWLVSTATCAHVIEEVQ